MIELAQKSPLSTDPAQQVVYAIAHDLQAPTRLIRSFLQLLEADSETQLGVEGRSYLDRVITATHDLQEKLTAITELSRVSSLGQEPYPCTVDDALNDALLRLQPALDNAGAIVRAVNTDHIVLADRAQLMTVFIEVIGNSLKFCDVAVQICVEVTTIEDRCQVSITDSGPGFSARHSAEAFDLFRRFHHADVPGTGTGLAIVRRILDRHQASVAIESSTTAGTIVSIDLPQPLTSAVRAPA